MSEQYRASKAREWAAVALRQLDAGNSARQAALVADTLVGRKFSPLWDPIKQQTRGLAEVVSDFGGIGKGGSLAVGLGKFLKKIVKVAAPIAMGFATGGVGGIALGGLKQVAAKQIAGAVVKKTLLKKAASVLTTRVLPGIGKVARGAGRLSGQAAKVASIGAAVGGGAAVGTRVGRGRGESLDVTFQDESGMIVKTRGRKRPGSTRRSSRSSRSAPIRRSSSRRRAPARRASTRRSSSRRAPARRAAPRRSPSRRRASPAQVRARKAFARKFGGKRRRR